MNLFLKKLLFKLRLNIPGNNDLTIVGGKLFHKQIEVIGLLLSLRINVHRDKIKDVMTL